MQEGGGSQAQAQAEDPGAAADGDARAAPAPAAKPQKTPAGPAVPLASAVTEVWAVLEAGSAEAAASSGTQKFAFTVDQLAAKVGSIEKKEVGDIVYTLECLSVLRRAKTGSKRAAVFVFDHASTTAATITAAVDELCDESYAVQDAWRLMGLVSTLVAELVRKFIALCARYGTVELDEVAASVCGPARHAAAAGSRRRATKKRLADVACILGALRLVRELPPDARPDTPGGGGSGPGVRAPARRFEWLGPDERGLGMGLSAAWASMKAAGEYYELDKLATLLDASAGAGGAGSAGPAVGVPLSEAVESQRATAQELVSLGELAARVGAACESERAEAEALLARAQRCLGALPAIVERREHYERAAKRARGECGRLLDKLLVYEDRAAEDEEDLMPPPPDGDGM